MSRTRRRSECALKARRVFFVRRRGETRYYLRTRCRAVPPSCGAAPFLRRHHHALVTALEVLLRSSHVSTPVASRHLPRSRPEARRSQSCRAHSAPMAGCATRILAAPRRSRLTVSSLRRWPRLRSRSCVVARSASVTEERDSPVRPVPFSPCSTTPRFRLGTPGNPLPR